MAVEGGNHRLGAVFDLLQGDLGQAAQVLGPGLDLQGVHIGAGDEDPVPRAGDDGGQNAGVILHLVHMGGQLLPALVIHGVADLGAVDGDPGYALDDLQGNVLRFHGNTPFGLRSSVIGRAFCAPSGCTPPPPP
ncbi:hypothetical protein SDC9_160033 [bioreactor metagenome]|uniref:Uncharacterized protein n=1 Tax=bioreactor metagenome TaxID=1076179 RepID=A0A645FJW5_9ZZZZ